MRPHRWQPTRLHCPWDSPGKNTGVGCHFPLQCRKVKRKLLSHVRLFAIPWTAAYQAPPSTGYSMQEYRSGVPLPAPLQGLKDAFLSLELVSSASIKRDQGLPWWLSGKETACNAGESESEIAQSCPTLCNPLDCSLSGSSVHGIFQARVLEWIAISFSRGSSRPRNRTRVSTLWADGQTLYLLSHQ